MSTPAPGDPYEAGRAACRAWAFERARPVRPAEATPEQLACWIDGWNSEVLAIAEQLRSGQLAGLITADSFQRSAFRKNQTGEPE